MDKVSSKMVVGEVIPRVQGLQGLADRHLPVRVAYRLGKIIKVLSDEAKPYDEQRLKLAQQYCEKDEKGNPVINDGQFRFSPENRAAFEKEHTELLTTEITVEATAIMLDDFKDIEASARELLLLGDFLVEEQE